MIFIIGPHTRDKSSTTLTLFDLIFIFYHGALQQQQRKQNMRDSDLKLTATNILGFIFIPPPFSPSHSTSLSISLFYTILAKKTRSAHEIQQKRTRARSKLVWVGKARRIGWSYDPGLVFDYLDQILPCLIYFFLSNSSKVRVVILSISRMKWKCQLL